MCLLQIDGEIAYHEKTHMKKRTKMLEVPKLQDLSIYAILPHIGRYHKDLLHLPRNLKVKLFNLLGKRGILTDNIIKYLANKDVLEVDFSESNITDSGLRCLKVCCYLQKLDLNSLRGYRTDISSNGMVQLLPCLKYLKILYLRRCKHVDDRVICSISKLEYLTELNVGGCSLITDVSVEALSTHCKQLKCLNLTRTKVSDIGLEYIANGIFSDKLQEIQVTYCPFITDDGVTKLSQKCQNLSIFSFHGCPKVSLDFDLNSNLESRDSATNKMVTWTISTNP